MPASGPPGSGAPPQDSSKHPAPSGKRPALGLQLKLPCASLADVQSRYGDDLKERRFFIRTRQPRPVDTLVRLEALLQDGSTCFRAAAVVVRVQEAPPAGVAPEPGHEPGMSLKILAADEAGQTLIAALGGKPPPLFRAEAGAAGRLAERSAPGPAAPKSAAVPSPAAAAPAAAAEQADAAEAAVADIDLDFGDEAAPAPTRPAPPAAKAAAARSAAATPPASAAPPASVSPAPAPAAPAPEPAAPAAGEPVISRRGAVIGIDLGTTNSCAAVVQKGKPLVIPSREGYNTIPSIVALSEKGKFIVGHPAKSQLLINPRNTVYGAKRLIGRQFASPAVTDLIHRFPYPIVAGARGEAAVQLGTQQLSLQKISSMVLAEVKEIAQQYLQQPVTRAVITVPAYYNDNQRQAVRHAGAMAGLFVERMVNEPTAAALAFAHGRKLSQRVLVYDLGGGTFDASVLELNDNVNEVISTGGDTFLGGTDFDKVLVDHLLEGFKQAHGIDFPGDRVALQRVTDAAERAKIALSEQLEYQVKVPFVAMVGEKPYDLEQTVRREELALLTSHLIDRTLEVCQQVLSARSLKPSDVDEVLLVGGQSRMPLVRERIRDFFKREPSRAVHPDEAVALGAALLAHGLDSPEPDAVLIDVLPMSVGVGLPGGRFKKVIERNTSLPHKKQLRIPASRDGQRQLEIAVFQGESDRISDNEYLGTLVVPAPPRGQPAAEAYDLEFSVSAECLLTVSAVDIKTGKAVTATFTTHDTPEAVRQRVADDAAARPAPAPPPAASAADNGVRGWMKRILPRT